MKAPGHIVEDIVGHRFAEPALLREALTHSSALNDRDGVARDYQRLEFLGDRVLGLVVSSYLVSEYPDLPEGELALRLNALVNRETLADVAADLGFDEAIIVGAREKDVRGRGRTSVLADIFEAVIGATFLDGGLVPAKAFIERVLSSHMASLDTIEKDPKSRLQEYLQGRGLGLPKYDIIQQDGPPHAPVFIIEARSDDGHRTEGRGTSRREAERQAALAMLKEFDE
jgi:ribonuclease-3